MNRVTKDTVFAGRANIDGGVVRYKSLPIRGAASTAEQDTGFDLPTSSIVPFPPYILIDAAASAASVINVGILATSSGDADGFLVGVSTTGTGVHIGTITTATSGASGAMFVSTTIGALIHTFTSGTTSGDPGLSRERPHAADSIPGKSITWTSNSTSTTLRATLVVPILEFS